MRTFDNDVPSVVTSDEWENEPCRVEVLDENATTRYAIKNNQATEAQIAEMREKVNLKNKGYSVLIDENKGESSKRLAEALADLDFGIISSDVLERVQNNINTPKDLLDYAKATESISNRCQKQATTTADIDKADQSAGGAKISLAFKDGTIAVGVQVGDRNGE